MMKKMNMFMITLIILGGLLFAGCSTTSAGKVSGKVKPYPLDTCIVSDNELGSMGDPVPFVHEGQEYKVCCKPCIKKFKEDPAKYQAILKSRSSSS
jgi:hypothetical protein